MECQVCYKHFTGSECPRCGFPVVESTNPDALASSMQSQIEQYRAAFLQKIRMELIIYRWKEEDGKIVLKKEDRLPFGPYSKLEGSVTWLPQVFARIPDVPSLDLKLSVETGAKKEIMTITVPNLSDPSLQQIGVETDDAMRFRLILKNGTGETRPSRWYEIP